MGSKCSCLSTQQELRQDTNIQSIASICSPTTSENRRFSIPASPLRLSEVFETTTTKYQHIELIESKESEDFNLNNDIHHNMLDINPLNDIHETINYLICGYIRNNINTTTQKYINVQNLTLFSIITKICYKYYNHYLLFKPSPNNNINDKNDNTFSIILNTLTDEKLLLDLLYNHWKLQYNSSEITLQFCLPIIHLQLLYRATQHGIDLKHFYNKCNNKGKSLLIVKSTDNCIFGGFTSVSYSNQTESVFDKEAFLWSLTQNKIFSINNWDIGKENIFHYTETDKIAIHFGNGPDLIIYQTCYVENKNHVLPYSFDFKVSELIGTLHNNGYFTVKEIEIFKVYGL